MEASIAPSIRWKATRLPPESTTATFIFQFRFFASATAARMASWARSSDIGGPYGVSKGILSGTKSRGFVSVGCSARLAVAAFPVFSFDISPPSMVPVQIARSTMNRDSLWLPVSGMTLPTVWHTVQNSTGAGRSVGLLTQPSRTSLDPDIPPARRLQAPHACGSRSDYHARHLQRRSPRSPRTRFLPQATRQHSPNPQLRRLTSPANLLSARPNALPLPALRMGPLPQSGFAFELVSGAYYSTS